MTWSLISGSTTLDLTHDNGYVITQVQGVSMPPVVNSLVEYAWAPGGYITQTRVAPRVITLVVDIVGSSWSDYAAKRRTLASVLGSNSNITLRYNDGSNVYDITCRYDGGLEGAGAYGFIETGAMIRLVCPDTYWLATYEESAMLTPAGTLDVRLIVRESNGVWDNLDGGLALGSVECITEGPDGTIYVGGNFTSSDAGTEVNNIARWDGSAWQPLGSGVSGGVTPTVRAIVFGPNGDVYVGGRFENASGVANTIGIARWDGSAWHSVGGGLESTSEQIYDLAFAPDGRLFATGYFSTIGGVSASNIAYWDGSSWHAIGTGLNQYGRALAAMDDGMYVAGTFVYANGVTVNYVAFYDYTTEFEALGTGLDAQALTLFWDAKDKLLYVGGSFTQAGGAIANKAAVWDGSRWQVLGSIDDNGFNADVYCFYRLNNGKIIITGDFTEAAGIECGRVALWNGYVFASAGVYIPSGLWDYGRAVYEDSTGAVWIGGGFETTIAVSAPTTVSNPGTAAAPVSVEIEAASDDTLWLLLRNETTGRVIWGNYTLKAGETLTISTAPGSVPARSTFRAAALANTPLPGSDMAAFTLAPGDNVISTFIYSSTTPTVTMRWTPRYLGVE